MLEAWLETQLDSLGVADTSDVVIVSHEAGVDACPGARVVFEGSVPSQFNRAGCCVQWVDRWRLEIFGCVPVGVWAETVEEQEAAIALQETAAEIFAAAVTSADDLADPRSLTATIVPRVEGVTPIELQGGFAGYAIRLAYVRGLSTQ